MATETELLSLPITAADIASPYGQQQHHHHHHLYHSHQLHHDHQQQQHFQHQQQQTTTQTHSQQYPYQYHPQPGVASWACDEWDTSLAPGLRQVSGCMASTGMDIPQDDVNDGMSDTTSNVEEACKRALDHFPCPTVAFPMPTLEFDFRIAVALNPEPSKIQNRVQKEITTVKGGMWSGSFGNGRVVAGGYDLGQARGFRPIRIVEGAFVLQTTDQPPAMLEMRTRGSLSGPCNVLDTLLNTRESKENIDPRQYGFRTFATVKTADKRYAEFVNCGLWVASGVWRGDELIIDAYRLT